MRIGHGFDSHAWDDKKTKPLTLGGVIFESQYSLKGHSDSDVVAHACIDALLGPIGLGDIGMHYPDDDPSNLNADSIEMLKEVVGKIGDNGWEIINIDCSVVAEKPNILKNKKEIDENITTNKFNVVDARSKERFEGKVPDPRKNVRSGSIPNSFCLPFKEILNEDNTFKNTEEISQKFMQIIDIEHNNIVFSCGSGVTASVLALAYSLINNKYMPTIYDGSWAEYGKIKI